MVQITCPSCAARYEVPEAALAPNGRQVTCSNCETVWLARAPSADGDTTLDTPTRQDRSRRMAEIRQMLDEVQHAEERRAAPPPRAEPAPQRSSRAVPPAPADPNAAWDEDEDDDAVRETENFLRERVGAGGQEARIKQMRADGTATAGDTKKLMAKHRRRHRMRQLDDKRGSGAGLTGFMLVVLVAGTLTGLYVFSPQISARMPESEPALRDYVTAVDSVRVGLAERITDLRAKIEEQMAEDDAG